MLVRGFHWQNSFKTWVSQLQNLSSSSRQSKLVRFVLKKYLQLFITFSGKTGAQTRQACK
jgi:hypothetical protein